MYWMYPPEYYYAYNPYYLNRNVMSPIDYRSMVQLESFYRNEDSEPFRIKDYGPHPFVLNIERATERNNTYRTAIWTGNHLQVTLMSINIGDDIGLEIHPHTDQFLRIEEGEGIVRMGKNRNHLDFERRVTDESAIMVPAGTWHNVINIGNEPLKLYSIYAPPHHPHSTVEVTKADAMKKE